MVSRYELLFEQWKASLASRDRKTPSIQGNFEDLFQSLKDEGLVLESAFEYMSKAVKAHSPNTGLIKNVFKKIKKAGTEYSSEKEFEEQWVKDIAERASIAFFNIFPVQTKKNEEENEPVIYGSMTAKEYKAQRKHAEEYPRFSTEELERQLSETYDPMKELASLLGTNSGDNK